MYTRGWTAKDHLLLVYVHSYVYIIHWSGGWLIRGRATKLEKLAAAIIDWRSILTPAAVVLLHLVRRPFRLDFLIFKCAIAKRSFSVLLPCFLPKRTSSDFFIHRFYAGNNYYGHWGESSSGRTCQAIESKRSVSFLFFYWPFFKIISYLEDLMIS